MKRQWGEPTKRRKVHSWKKNKHRHHHHRHQRGVKGGKDTPWPWRKFTYYQKGTFAVYQQKIIKDTRRTGMANEERTGEKGGSAQINMETKENSTLMIKYFKFLRDIYKPLEYTNILGKSWTKLNEGAKKYATLYVFSILHWIFLSTFLWLRRLVNYLVISVLPLIE